MGSLLSGEQVRRPASAMVRTGRAEMGEEGMRDATGANAAGTGCATSPATHIAWVPSLTVACFALHLAWHSRLFEGIGQHGQPDGIEMACRDVAAIHLLRAPRLLQGISQDGQPHRIEMPADRVAFLVGCRGQTENGRGANATLRARAIVVLSPPRNA